MISVCIPVYNFDVRPAVKELHNQLKASGVSFEILLLDDASQPQWGSLNKSLDLLDFVEYKALETNVGRSRIRNLLAQWAQFDNLLFLDCDVIISKSNFISNYINSIASNAQVVCGGRIYPVNCPSRSQKLRWKYGLKSESQNAEIRKKHPSRSFMTNNFIIKKLVFSEIKFDEKLSNYGHEDTLFGYDLKQKNIIPLHIENPVLNGDIETDEVFLEKTTEGVINLSKIYTLLKDKSDFVEDVTLLAMYQKLLSFNMIISGVSVSSNLFLKLLKSGVSSIFVFNLYKLALFAKHQKQG